MKTFQIDLVFGVEAENADQAAEAFGDWLGMSFLVEVRVTGPDGAVSYLDVQL